jgi:putative membrane protein
MLRTCFFNLSKGIIRMLARPELSIPRTACKLSQTLAVAALAALALTSLPAGAQGTGSSSSATGAAGVTSTGAPRIAGNNPTGGMVARNDSKMMIDLAQGNMGEIEAGKLALEKSQNEQVKKFAQQMVDDHTAALKELQTLAQTKGVALPDGMNAKQKTMGASMKAMAGNTFDSQYMKHAGLDDHRQTLKLLQKIQKSAKDADFKAMAAKMLPTVQGHLKMAQETPAKAAKS